jgi:WD40 repeat protein
MEDLSISETGTWIVASRLHRARVTSIQYVAELKCIISSSEDGTVKLTEVVYHGTALSANESLVLGTTRTFEGHEGKVVNGFFYEAGSIYSYGWSRSILQWDPVSFKVSRTFYVGSSVRDAQILNGVSSSHLVVLTVPRVSSPDDDTLQTQWMRVYDVIGGEELQNFSKDYSSYIRGGGAQGVSTTPMRESTSLLVRSSDVHNGVVLTGGRGSLSILAVPPVWSPIGSLQLDGSLVVPTRGFRAEVTHEHVTLLNVLISPLFDFVATIDQDQLVRLWDLNTGCHVHAWTVTTTTISKGGGSGGGGGGSGGAPSKLTTASLTVTASSMDGSGQYVLFGFNDASVRVMHVFSGELLLTLHSPTTVADASSSSASLSSSSQKKGGEIMHIRHVQLKGGKNFIIATTSTGTLIAWNLGSGVPGAPGIIIGLVTHPVPCSSTVPHASMVLSLDFQPVGQCSRKNLLGMSTLDGRILILDKLCAFRILFPN